MNINVQGRLPTGPVKGFGRLWDKRYRLRIESGAPDPREIVSLWKAEFPDFWPGGNRFFPANGAAIAPGTVAVLNLRLPGGLVVATGLMVLYVSDTSFSFISIQGHIISGWITFSSFREGTATIMQVHPLFRPSDPLMELSLPPRRRRAGRPVLASDAGQPGRAARRPRGNRAARCSSGCLASSGASAGNIGLSAPIRSSFYMPFHVLKKALRR